MKIDKKPCGVELPQVCYGQAYDPACPTKNIVWKMLAITKNPLLEKSFFKRKREKRRSNNQKPFASKEKEEKMKKQ